MSVSITKLESNAVKLDFTNPTGTHTITYLQDPTEVEITSEVVETLPAVVLKYNHKTLSIMLRDITDINGLETPSDIDETVELLTNSVFNDLNTSGGGGTGAVDSVTGNIVDDSDPANPVINFPIGDERQVPLYKNGEIVADRLGWAQFSDLPTPPSFLNGVLTGTGFNENGSALFAFLELALGPLNTSIAKPNSIPFYNPGIIGTGGGTLPVADARETGDAVNLGQIQPFARTGSTLVVAQGATAALARAAIGAGTGNSNLALGTTATTAAAGNHGHGAVNTFVKLTQVEYDALPTKVETTFYIIVG